jgi:hypothetical protein
MFQFNQGKENKRVRILSNRSRFRDIQGQRPQADMLGALLLGWPSKKALSMSVSFLKVPGTYSLVEPF